MEIFGVGSWELIVILIILVIVAGPKRMIAWSYQLGKYIAVLRNMWVETAKQLQKEFDAAGVDVQVPKELPTRQNIKKEIARQVAPITKPLEETMQNLKVTADDVRQPLKLPPDIKAPAPSAPPVESNGSQSGTDGFGTWSTGEEQK